MLATLPRNAQKVFEEVGNWIFQSGFQPLRKWHNNLGAGWDTLKNYFRYRVTSSLSEGQNNVIQNNVIKMLKRRAFGFRNMEYFKLKIMQLCGYLNSRFIYHPNQYLTLNSWIALYLSKASTLFKSYQLFAE
jgi:transposase